MSTTRKTPKLRFPEFTDDWEQRKLFDIADFKSGQGLSLSDISKEGTQECILYGNLYTDYGMIITSVLKSTNAIPSNPVYSKNGDVLVPASDTTPTGLARASCLEKSGVLLGGDINIIRPRQGINGSCLSLAINHNKRQLIRLIKGTTVKHIHNSDLSTVVVALPKNLDEQREIVNTFKNLDNLITLHQRELDSLKKLKKSLLQKMFPKNGEKIPELRFPEFTGDWEQRKLFDIADFKSGQGLSLSDISKEGTQECILYGNLYTDYGMIITSVLKSTNAIPSNPVYSKNGDVLVPASDTTPTGLARASCLEKSGVLLGGDINIIRPRQGINGSCLSLAINHNKRQLIRLIKGTTVKHIHNSDLSTVVVALPKNLDEQREIVNTFKNLDNLITLHQRELDTLKKLKKGLLQNMFV